VRASCSAYQIQKQTSCVDACGDNQVSDANLQQSIDAAMSFRSSLIQNKEACQKVPAEAEEQEGPGQTAPAEVEENASLAALIDCSSEYEQITQADFDKQMLSLTINGEQLHIAVAPDVAYRAFEGGDCGYYELRFECDDRTCVHRINSEGEFDSYAGALRCRVKGPEHASAVRDAVEYLARYFTNTPYPLQEPANPSCGN
jgi:hypothetical protein